MPGASPGFLGVSYACPNVPRPTLTSHHITKPIGLCWPKYLNEVTTCHLQERTNSFYSLVSARSRLPRAGHSSWLHGRAKSRAVDEAVFVGRSPHMPFLSCRGFALSPGTGRDTRDPKTVKNVFRSNLLPNTDQRRRCSRHETHNQYWSGQSQHNWLPVRRMQKKHLFPRPSEGHWSVKQKHMQGFSSSSSVHVTRQRTRTQIPSESLQPSDNDNNNQICCSCATVLA